MNKLSIALVFFVLILTLGCIESSNKEQGNYTNPNGDSELALLMREMYFEGVDMKKSIRNGVKPELIKKFKEIHTAEATEPEKVLTPEYKMYSDAYINSLELLEASSQDDLITSYHAMVNSCMNCHKVMCPGPMVRIKKLYIASAM